MVKIEHFRDFFKKKEFIEGIKITRQRTGDESLTQDRKQGCSARGL